jgi:hypothetical protein
MVLLMEEIIFWTRPLFCRCRQWRFSFRGSSAINAGRLLFVPANLTKDINGRDRIQNLLWI